MSRFKNAALGTMLVVAVFVGSVLSLTTSASAQILIDGQPIPAGGFTIEFLPTGVVGPETRLQPLIVDATGFENLTVSFTIRGVEDIEPNCGVGSGDCFEVFEDTVSIVGPLDIPCATNPPNNLCDPIASLTDFGPIALTPVAV